MTAGLESTGSTWRKVVFSIDWPQGKPPLQHMDLLLAHRVIWPVLAQHEKHVQLWKFHRRWKRDESGHQFEFSFYSSAQTARQIHDSVFLDQHYMELKRAGRVGASYDETIGSRIEDICPTNWPPEIRRSWPYFIMGVSRMWVTLIEQIMKSRTVDESPSIAEWEATCQKVDGLIGRLWLHQERDSRLWWGFGPLQARFEASGRCQTAPMK